MSLCVYAHTPFVQYEEVWHAKAVRGYRSLLPDKQASIDTYIPYGCSSSGAPYIQTFLTDPVVSPPEVKVLKK